MMGRWILFGICPCEGWGGVFGLWEKYCFALNCMAWHGIALGRWGIKYTI
jgi:hypothetical protein